MNKIYNTCLIAIAAGTALLSCEKTRQPSLTVEGFGLGTVYKVTVVGNAPDSLRSKVESILALADSTMSVFNPNSLLSRLNRNETDLPNEDIIYNIELAQGVSELSAGKYDITVQPLLEAYGFIDGRQEADINVDSILQYVGYEKISLRDGRLVKELPGIEIGLNSVAKGYTVDKVAAMLDSEGAGNYMVNIGGEIFCRGTNPDGERWRIAIDTPYEGNYIPGRSTSAVIGVSGMGIATSGNYRNFHTGPGGEKYTHIIDPLTGSNTESRLLSATVVAETCALADALATMFMAMGMEDSFSLLGNHTEFAVLLIYSTDEGHMKTYATKAMDRYLHP